MGTHDEKKDQLKAGRSATRSASPGSAGTSEAPDNPDACETADRFAKDVEVRGEAAKLTPDGKLPLDATHVVVEENPDGTAKKIERARFKAF
jgi:hypothetical protein